jgi:hypothetical protein
VSEKRGESASAAKAGPTRYGAPRAERTAGLAGGSTVCGTPDMHTASSQKSEFTIAVWVWKDHYGGLHADTNQTRPGASVLHVPLPFAAAPLQRLYGNLIRMIGEREAADGPVHTNRASLSVRVWETSDGQLDATLTRRKGATVATLLLPTDLEQLRQLHDKVVPR